MKKKIFSLIAVAAALVLAGCGETQPDASSAGATPTSSKKATSSKIPSSKHEHTFNEAVWDHNETQHWHPATCEHTTAKGSVADHDFEDFTDATHTPVAAGCETPGKAYKKCKVCGYIKEVTIPALGHNFEPVANTTVTAEGMTEWYQVKCSRNDATGIGFSALKYVANGSTSSDPFSNKDNTGATLKMNKNGNYVDYVINVPSELAMANCTIWMHGWVDYFKDGNTNNDQRGFFSGKNDCPDGNFKFTVNESVVTITNTSTYEEMGLEKGDGSNDNASTFGFVKVGASAIKAGENTIRYERVESYNMNIDAIYFIAPVAAHA